MPPKESSGAGLLLVAGLIASFSLFTLASVQLTPAVGTNSLWRSESPYWSILVGLARRTSR